MRQRLLPGARRNYFCTSKAPTSPSEPLAGAFPMHILFVDDTSETRELFQLCFSVDGHTVDTAPHGKEALRLVEEHADDIDVIIMDYHMWGMTGLEVVRQLRKMDKLPPIPIILYTADANEKVASEAEELGVAQVVSKPALPTQLIAIAEQLVHGGEGLANV